MTCLSSITINSDQWWANYFNWGSQSLRNSRGSLYDITGSYNPGFMLAGSAIGLSGIILFLIPVIQRWHAKKIQDKRIHIHL